MLLFTLLLGGLCRRVAAATLLLLPVSQLVKSMLDCFLLRLVRPGYVLRMEPERPVPPEAKTLCVISVLLYAPEAGVEAAGLLEQYSLANRRCGKNLVFGLLCDLPEEKQAEMAADLPAVQKAKTAVQVLNEKYGSGFVLLLRPRTYSAADNCYMSWERKRGAILELMRLLRAKNSGLRPAAGDETALQGIHYVISLDADTRLNIGAAGELIAAMAHPLHVPRIENDRVIQGYGALAPRIGTQLQAARATDFARIFAVQGGIDPYGCRTSDLYFDLYNSGSFSEKGILHVDAYLRCLDGRFPENRILSHDLLEGPYLHCGYAGDVELSDGFPSRALSYFARLQRWIRGDWQAATWACARVPAGDGRQIKNMLPLLERWKIFDNLRRSLVPPSVFAVLLAGLLCESRGMALAATLALLLDACVLLLPMAVGGLQNGMLRRRRMHGGMIYGVAGAVMQLLLKLALLPVKAVLSLEAIGTALYRLFFSKQKLLEWTTAADADANGRGICTIGMIPGRCSPCSRPISLR